jgi:hypothetical protein
MPVNYALLSRTSIIILSFILVQTGMARSSNPSLAVVCVLAGTTGFLAYVGVKWSAFLRNR